MADVSKAFTKEGDGEECEQEEAEALPAGQKNYVTPQGFEALRSEWRMLLYTERLKIVEIVSWAAGNGDRSENGDYIYGKKRLREIDRRVRYLAKRIESATVVDPEQQKNLDQVFFGATVTYAGDDGVEKRVTIVGVDEADMGQGKISWVSPVARALTKARIGDVVELKVPGGVVKVEVLEVGYASIG
jgi:transcription elongation factor GreB